MLFISSATDDQNGVCSLLQPSFHPLHKLAKRSRQNNKEITFDLGLVQTLKLKIMKHILRNSILPNGQQTFFEPLLCMVYAILHRHIG
ncbi:hypothetical protein OPV22_011399 [Ensete ventricosum]|uniref:Uncharacterized protein n=1 Tax=Ensete ventricosum TaxID=4639 RepID=A0AAV8RIZ5_ENSVE|nr:hypothetical protein OPV22_011399 [Ensete ventricosum]